MKNKGSSGGTPTARMARTWIRVIQDQYRIRIKTEEFRESLSLLGSEKKLTVWAGIGKMGQLQLFHPESTIALARDSIDESLTVVPLTAEDAVSKRGAYMRYASALWTVSFDEDMPGRLTIKLPSEAQAVKLLPGVGETVVVFGSGQLLEIWEVGNWINCAKKEDGLLLHGLPSVPDE